MSHPKQTQKSARPKRNPRKRAAALLALLLALLMILPMLTMVVQTALAATQDELQAQINAGKAEANELNSRIDALEDQLNAIQDDKSQVMEQKSLLEQVLRQVLEEDGVLAVHIPLPVVLQGLLSIDEGGRGHVGNLEDLTLQGPGAGLVHALLHIGGELILGLQVPQGVVQADRHQGEGAHDNQARHNHTHGGKRHKPVGEDAVEALFQVITHIILTHCYNTHLSRR